jgi:hypothetical protein
MLLQLRSYMRREVVVSSQQLSREFHIDPTALQPMLDLWIKKGLIAPCQSPPSCKTSACVKCVPSTQYYQYLG